MKKCKKCNSENLELILTPETIHYGKYICKDCKSFNGWKKNPDSLIKGSKSMRIGKRKINQVCKFHKMDEEICFFCLRNRTQLGKNETLTTDHIIELSDGGKDIIENTQVLCSACHKLKNW